VNKPLPDTRIAEVILAKVIEQTKAGRIPDFDLWKTAIAQVVRDNHKAILSATREAIVRLATASDKRKTKMTPRVLAEHVLETLAEDLTVLP